MRARFNLDVPLRDGIELAADLYRPDADRPSPTIVTGTPYGKNNPSAPRMAERFAECGYAVLWYDVRGRGDSDGTFQPYRNEGRDGYDVIEWTAAQDWCNGKIASWGGSYSGHSQWLTAVERPPHLNAIVAYCTPSDPFVDWPTGVHIPWQVCWYRMVDGRVLQDISAVDWDTVYRHLPLATMDLAAGFVSANWRRDLAHPSSDVDYWAPLAYQQRLSEVDAPALHVTGWYDDVHGTIRNFARMTRNAATDRARRAQHLLVGPWGHDVGQNNGRIIGDVDFGDDAQSLRVKEVELRFVDHYLRGTDNGVDREPRVRVFVMGENRWRHADEWPLADVACTSLYLHSDGHANTRHGSGQLTLEPPASPEPTDGYHYDPADPVPFLAATAEQIGGPDDYSVVEDRQDVLVYAGPVLTEELTVVGPVTAELFVISDCPDTDFTAKLVDIQPDGVRRRLCDGIVRGRYRRGVAKDTPLKPGQVYRIEVDLWSTAHAFSPGHQVGLEISSSAFPKYDRNLNNGAPIATATEMRTAHNQVLHTPQHPSRVILPVAAAESS